jgi:23S rRNA (guanosine2251-2'-O)-methyltransferase
MSRPDVVYGIHPVLEALRASARRVERVFVARERRAGLGQLLRLAREAGVPISHLDRETLARKVGARAVHQGVAAAVAPFDYADAEALCRSATGSPQATLVLVDRVVDPRNLGSIVRTAAGGGASGLLVATGGAAGLTPAAMKTAAGAAERLPVAREARPRQRIEALHQGGFRSVVLDPRGEIPWDRAELKGRLLIVAGGEGRGVRPGIAAACHQRVRIPLAAGVESLNVAVAVGVLLFEACRQRRALAVGLETTRTP